VIHDVGLPHFRLKMDAVPGIPTTMWFTPTITTAKMKEITGDKEFVYEISCDQMCGAGHFSMRGVVIVETQAEYDEWMSKLTPQYTKVMNDKKGAEPAKPVADTVKVSALK